MKTKKLVTIVGSVDPDRQYNPPVENIAGAKEVAESLGTELAKSGYRIIVYSAESGFIESDVVKGFVKSGKAGRKSIIVHYPTGQAGAAAFPEYAEHMELFDSQPDDSLDWEISFYRSLGQAGGTILIGGGRSTLITGVLALTYRLPILTLAAHGGSAREVWKLLKNGHNLATEDEINEMALEGTAEQVKAWVRSFETQSIARQKERREEAGCWPTILTLFLLVGWVALLPLGEWLLPSKNTAGTDVPLSLRLLVFLAPLLSGASGATIRTLFPEGEELNLRTTVKGIAAGVISAELYLLAQLAGNQAPYNSTVLIFSVLIGFIAGFTFDRVFKKLEAVDVLQTDVLQKTGLKSRK